MSFCRLFLRRTPAVSMAMNVRPSRSKRTSTLSRVVPGTSLTIIRSLSARLLMKVLLPVLRRPTMASLRATGLSAFSASPRFLGRQPFGNQLQQQVAVAVLLGTDQHQLAAAELVELGRWRLDLRRVALVGDTQDRLGDVTQPGHHFLVERRDAVAGIDDEQDNAGLVMAASICFSMCEVRLSTSLMPMPPVSTSSKKRSSILMRLVIRSRVTPAVGSTMAMRRRASQLNSDDLPTLGRPTMATTGTGTSTSPG